MTSGAAFGSGRLPGEARASRHFPNPDRGACRTICFLAAHAHVSSGLRECRQARVPRRVIACFGGADLSRRRRNLVKPCRQDRVERHPEQGAKKLPRAFGEWEQKRHKEKKKKKKKRQQYTETARTERVSSGSVSSTVFLNGRLKTSARVFCRQATPRGDNTKAKCQRLRSVIAMASNCVPAGDFFLCSLSPYSLFPSLCPRLTGARG